MDELSHLSFLSLSLPFSLRLYLYLIIVFIGQKPSQRLTFIDMYSVNYQETLYTPVRTLYPESPSYIEEQFPDWLEEKIDLPIFDDLPPPPVGCLDIGGLKAFPRLESDAVTLKTSTPFIETPAIGVGCRVPPQTSIVNPQPYHQATSISAPPLPIPIDQTAAFMQELDYGLGVGGGGRTGTPHDTLTPPESPRDGDLLVFTMLQEMQPHELDELVRMRADSLVEESPEPVSSSAYEESDSAASPCSSVDPDWNGPFSARGAAAKRSKRVSAKPYTRAPPEERKQRKKEQNKNAATRYRLKKKQEVEEIMGEEKELRQKNENLKQQLTELARETKYLKNLMRELFKAKGLIK